MPIPCEESRYIGTMALDFETETIMRSIVIAFLLLIFPFAVILNCLLIFLFGRFKILRQTTFYLALQVVVVDLASVLFITPITTTNGIAQQWILGSVFCTISTFVIYFLQQSRQYLMFLFVTDRFCLVFFPFRYKKYRQKVVILICIGVYSIAVIMSSIVMILDCASFSRITWYCWVNSGCTNPQTCGIWNAISVSLSIILGSFVPLIMYTSLFIKAKIIRNQVVSISSEQTSPHSNNERRANTTFLILFLSLFGVVIIPFLLYLIGTAIVQQFDIPLPPVHVILTTLSVVIFQILPIVDPIAIMRHPDVRKVLSFLKKKLLKIRENKSPHQQASTVNTPPASHIQLNT